MAEWRTALLKSLGVPVTPRNKKFLSAWQRWEGGHTNWLNTTRNTPGAVASINSVGVKAYRSFDDGIQALTETLRNGRYQDILDGLAAGDPYSAKPVAGLSTWVSGSADGNLGYASKVLGTKVSAAPASPLGRGKGVTPKQPKGIDKMAFFEIAFEDDPVFLQQLASITDSHAQKTGMVSPRGSVNPVAPANGVVSAAQTQLGKPYVFGSGADTSSFDCSDLIQWAYAQNGIHIPRTTFDQIKVGRSVKWSQLQPGDMIFPSTHHVVMYVGHGKVIAAPHTGTVVQYQPLEDFKNPVAIRRP